MSIAFAHELNFLLTVDLSIIVAIKILSSSSKILVGPLALSSVILAATHLLSALLSQILCICNLLMISFLQPSGVMVIGLSLPLLLLEELGSALSLLAISGLGRGMHLTLITSLIASPTATSTSLT